MMDGTFRHGHHDFGGTSLRRQTTYSKFIFRGRYLLQGDPEDSDLFIFILMTDLSRGGLGVVWLTVS
jgi:hypothetical protein